MIMYNNVKSQQQADYMREERCYDAPHGQDYNSHNGVVGGMQRAVATELAQAKLYTLLSCQNLASQSSSEFMTILSNLRAKFIWYFLQVLVDLRRLVSSRCLLFGSIPKIPPNIAGLKSKRLVNSQSISRVITCPSDNIYVPTEGKRHCLTSLSIAIRLGEVSGGSLTVHQGWVIKIDLRMSKVYFYCTRAQSGEHEDCIELELYNPCWFFTPCFSSLCSGALCVIILS